MIKRRDGSTVEDNNIQDRFLNKMYRSGTGRRIMRCLSRPVFSDFSGWVLTKPISKRCINLFIRKYNLDMSQYDPVPYKNFDEFFSRYKKQEFRDIDVDESDLISPCDGKLTVYPISDESHFYIKQSYYSLESLLQDKELAETYENGYALIFRMTADNYHRYCYVADGMQEESVHIPGAFYTVHSVINDYHPVYKENTREYCLCHTKSFGDMVTMEVGALMVGKIVNHQKSGLFSKGQEKGYFRFGGSTIVLLFRKDTIEIDRDILQNSIDGIETMVQYGEKIGDARKE